MAKLRATYSNGIVRERYTAVPSDASVVFCECVRQGDGKWSLLFRLSGSVQLPDGRSLVFDRPLRVRAEQHGRKPHPKRRVETVTVG